MAKQPDRSRPGRGKGGLNRSQAIRDYMAEHRREGPKDIIAGLAQRGIEVSAALVSNVKYGSARKGAKRRGTRKGGRRRGLVGSRRGRASITVSDKVSISLLIEAKRLVDKLGGIERARQALDTLARLS